MSERFQPLGKPLPPPAPPKKPDVIERISADVIRRNGKLETRDMQPEPKHRPITPSEWDLIRKRLQEQMESGYGLDEFGVM
jgi:hypothetical protein